jgi:hypothetical protein
MVHFSHCSLNRVLSPLETKAVIAVVPKESSAALATAIVAEIEGEGNPQCLAFRRYNGKAYCANAHFIGEYFSK